MIFFSAGISFRPVIEQSYSSLSTTVDTGRQLCNATKNLFWIIRGNLWHKISFAQKIVLRHLIRYIRAARQRDMNHCSFDDDETNAHLWNIRDRFFFYIFNFMWTIQKKKREAKKFFSGKLWNVNIENFRSLLPFVTIMQTHCVGVLGNERQWLNRHQNYFRSSSGCILSHHLFYQPSLGGLCSILFRSVLSRRSSNAMKMQIFFAASEC